MMTVNSDHDYSLDADGEDVFVATMEELDRDILQVTTRIVKGQNPTDKIEIDVRFRE